MSLEDQEQIQRAQVPAQAEIVDDEVIDEVEDGLFIEELGHDGNTK